MKRLMSRESFGPCPRARNAVRQLAKMPGYESTKVPSRSRSTVPVMILLLYKHAGRNTESLMEGPNHS